MSALADPSYATDELAHEWDTWSVSRSQAAYVGAETLFRIDAPTLVDSGWLYATTHDLERVMARRYGWDSYNALPTTIDSVSHALRFLGEFLQHDSAPPTIVPLADGGVQLEWHRGGVDIEASFPAGDRPELYVRDLESGDEYELDLSQGYDAALPYVTRLSA